MNNKTLVSVIIPTHNRDQLILRAVNSVLCQTYRKFECIIIDDCSNDDTEKNIKSINDIRIVYLRHKKQKYASGARNTGIKHAKGELIAFLDDDDEWYPTKLEKQVRLISRLPKKIGMIYCWMDYFDNKNHLIREVHPRLKGNVFKYVLDSQRLGGCPTLMVRKQVIHKIGNFDETLKRGNDGDFIRRVTQRYEVDYVPEVLVKVHVDCNIKSITYNDKEGATAAIRAETIKLEKFSSILNKYPREKSNILSLIAINYIKQGEWMLGITSFFEAYKADTLNKLFMKRLCQSLNIIFKKVIINRN